MTPLHLLFFLFADGTNIYLESSNLSYLEKIMNKELEKLYDWLCINRLSLNVSKTNFVIFHVPNKPLVTILINKQAIDEAKYVKYLGILGIINSQLTFTHHINELVKQISRGIGILYKLKPFVTPKILKSVYYAIIYPFLLYGITVWGPACNTYITPIYISYKKRFSDWLPKKINTPTFLDHLLTHPHSFHKLGILIIFDIYKLQVGKLVYESLNSIGPSKLIIKFTKVSEMHIYNTRFAKKGNIYNNYARTTRFGLKLDHVRR